MKLENAMAKIRASVNRKSVWLYNGDRLLCTVLIMVFLMGFLVGCPL